VTARSLRRSEAWLAADYLARAEAWVDQVAPELRADIARIRLQLLHPAGSRADGTPADPGHQTDAPAIGQAQSPS
jgi:hypothetical protein